MINIADLRDLPLLVGGSFARTAERARVTNPADGSELTSVPIASLDLLDQAVARANEALQNWRVDVQARGAALLEIASRIEKNVDVLAESLAREIGLPIKLAAMEVSAGAAYLRYRAGAEAKTDLIKEDAKEHTIVVRRPIGVVGAILPWNAPFLIACEKIATSFGAGNAVIVKPSLYAPVTLLRLGVLLGDAVPAGTLSILTGGDDLGVAIVKHPGIGMISFTGSIAAGKAIMASAAANLKRLSLELGGNDAAIVLSDVEVERVASRLVTGAFFRSGQVCAAIKRLYVQTDIFDDLCIAMVRAAEKIAVGDPMNPKVTMGPISNRAQFERVCALVEAAKADGATVLTGGQPIEGNGYFYPPTLLANVSAEARIVSEEQFGPVLPLLPFSDPADAVAKVNATPFGLGNSVWTADSEKGEQIARQLESGSVWINRHGIVLPHVPFGGMKQSGIGRTNGSVGMDLYSELQTVSVFRS